MGDKVIGNPALGTFAAFGSFAMLLLVDFSGSIRDRLLDQAALGVSCAVLICLATLASRTTWITAAAMAVVAFAVLFAGVISSLLVGATTSLLLAFILLVSLPGPGAFIPERVAGWALTATVSLVAISLLWPSPKRNPVRTAAITASRAIAARLRADISYATSSGGAGAAEPHHAAIARAGEAVNTMQRAFFATPYRPSSLSTDARAVVRIVDELRLLNSVVLRSAPKQAPRLRPSPHVCAVKMAAAGVLERAAELLEAAAASWRLDDTFRGYLSERGSKPAPLADITGLLSRVTGVRLAADAVLELWNADGARGGQRSAARRELMSAARRIDRLVRPFRRQPHQTRSRSRSAAG